MNELTTVETAELESYEAVIKEGLKTFFQVGNALAKIKQKKLYRRDHETFEDYCQSKWSIGRSYANKLIGAAVVVENLGTRVPKPTSEAQVRPMRGMEPAQQKEAWEAAVNANEGKQPTSAQVRQAVRRVTAESFDDGWSHDDEPAPTPAVSRIGGGKRYDPIVITCDCGNDCWSADERGAEVYLVCDECGHQHRPLCYA